MRECIQKSILLMDKRQLCPPATALSPRYESPERVASGSLATPVTSAQMSEAHQGGKGITEIRTAEERRRFSWKAGG